MTTLAGTFDLWNEPEQAAINDLRRGLRSDGESGHTRLQGQIHGRHAASLSLYQGGAVSNTLIRRAWESLLPPSQPIPQA